MIIAVVMIHNTLVRAMALRIESNEKITFITTIIVITLDTEPFDFVVYSKILKTNHMPYFFHGCKKNENTANQNNNTMDS